MGMTKARMELGKRGQPRKRGQPDLRCLCLKALELASIEKIDSVQEPVGDRFFGNEESITYKERDVCN